MTNNPRRGLKSAHNRSFSRLNASLPKTMSHPTLSSEPPPQDPFQAISRSIHAIKLRTGARLVTLAATSRQSRLTARNRFFYLRTASTTRLFLTLTILLFLLTALLDRSDNHRNYTLAALRAIFSDHPSSALSPSLAQMLRHRPPPITTPHFATGPWVIAVISDMDRESCHLQQTPQSPIRPVPCAKANAWLSYLKRGVLNLNQSKPLSWLDEIQLVGHGRFEWLRNTVSPPGGRGMELSELEWFHGHLLAPDDHTGSLLEVMAPRGGVDAPGILYGKPSAVLPATFRRATLLDGNGKNRNAFFKAEWMVVKDDLLVIGGHGRSFTDPLDGTKIRHWNAKWVKVVAKDFSIKHLDWSARYDMVANAVGVSFPGYLMHEAVLWSTERKEWIFLPRRVSKEAFDPRKNEQRGSNMIIIASEDFKNISALQINGLKDSTGLKGFSSAKFVPGTNDCVIAAIRTIETEGNVSSGKGRETASFISVFELKTGKILLAEEKISSKKFEGLVFL